MKNNRNQIAPKIEINTMSQVSTLSKSASDQLQMDTSRTIAAIVWKRIAEQHKPRRRSLDNMLDDNITRDQWNREEIVREAMRQVN